MGGEKKVEKSNDLRRPPPVFRVRFNGIGERFLLRQKQAKKKLDLDITKITEVVPS
jgi:hypothetical protein